MEEPPARLPRFACEFAWLCGVVLGAVVVLALLLHTPSPWPAGGEARIVWLSDIHYNPYFTSALGPSCKCMSYGPFLCAEEQSWALAYPYDQYKCLAGAGGNPWGQFGCDSPAALVVSALASAGARRAPAFVLVTGDSVSHDSCQFPTTDPWTAALGIIGEISAEVVRTFPQSAGTVHVHLHARKPGQITAVLGNDDFVPDYYVPNVTDGALSPRPLPWLGAVAKVLRPPLGPRAREQFVRGGAVRYDVGPVVVLALNTVVYSPDHAEVSGPAGADPFGQFAWLDRELSSLPARSKAIIVGHIPPTVDQYSFKLEWMQEYALRYVAVVRRHASVVSLQLFGHTHQNMLRAFPRGDGDGEDGGPPLLVTAAVTPIYNNNPTYQDIAFDARSRLPVDFTVYAANLSDASAEELDWLQLYSARQRYPYNVLTSSGMRALAKAMMTNDTLYEYYLTDRLSGAPSATLNPTVVGYQVGRASDGLRPASVGAEKTFRAQLACSIAEGYVQAVFDACVAAGGPAAQ